jgi:hypothetical protein
MRGRYVLPWMTVEAGRVGNCVLMGGTLKLNDALAWYSTCLLVISELQCISSFPHTDSLYSSHSQRPAQSRTRPLPVPYQFTFKSISYFPSLHPLLELRGPLPGLPLTCPGVSLNHIYQSSSFLLMHLHTCIFLDRRMNE